MGAPSEFMQSDSSFIKTKVNSTSSMHYLDSIYYYFEGSSYLQTSYLEIK